MTASKRRNHQRTFRRSEQGLEIDQILGGTKQAQSYLHFHPIAKVSGRRINPEQPFRNSIREL